MKAQYRSEIGVKNVAFVAKHRRGETTGENRDESERENKDAHEDLKWISAHL